MPIAPRTVQPIADQTPYQRQTAYYTPGAFGRGEGRAIAGIGQSLDNAADRLDDVATRVQIRDNERRAKELDVEFTRRKRELLYGENGFYNQQGSNAVAAVENTKAGLAKIREDLAKEAGNNPMVAEMFDVTSAARLQQELETVDRYTAKERQVANKLAAETRIQEAIEDTALAWNDPKAYQRAEVIVKSEILDIAEQEGWEPEVAQSKIEEATSEIYFRGIEQALNTGHVREAQEMLKANSSKLEAAQSGKVSQAIISEQRSLAAEARSQQHFQWAKEDRARALQERADKEYTHMMSQQLVDQYIGLNLTEEEARKEAQSIVDPKLREEVEQRFDLVRARMDREDRKLRKDAAREAYRQVYEEEKTVPEILSGLGDNASYLTEDPSLMAGLERAQVNVAEGKLYAPHTDGETYARLKTLPKAQLAEVDPLAYRDKLTETEFNKLLTDVAYAGRQINESGDIAAKVLNNAEADLTRDLRGNPTFFDGSKPTDAFHTAITDLRNWVYERVEQTGKAPTDREVKQQAAVLTTTFEGRTGWLPWTGFSGEQLRNMTEEQKQVARLSIDRVPSDMLSDIAADLAGVGVKAEDVPDSVLEEMAAAIFLRQRDRYNRLLNEAQE